MYTFLKTCFICLLCAVGLQANPEVLDSTVSYHGLLERYQDKLIQVENQSPFISKKSILGSGVLVSPDGYAITTETIISGMERVTLRYSHSHLPVTAKVVAREKSIDLALLKVRVDQALPYLKIGTTHKLRTGDVIFILFRSPELGMRKGIVTSAQKGVVVTDIPALSDTFGALLVDGEGNFLGLVSKELSVQNRYTTAVTAKYLAESSAAMMKQDRTVHGFFGMSVDDLSPSQYGVYGTDKGTLVTSVDTNRSAERAGLKKGDLIVSVNKLRVGGRKAFSESLYEAKAEDNVTIGYIRNRLQKELTMRLPIVDQSVLNPNVFVHRGMVVEDITPDIRSMRGLPPYLKGVYVLLVMPGSLAEKRGIRPGDVIIQLGTKTIDDLASFKEYAGKSARERLFIYRDGWNFIRLLAEEEKKK